MRQFWNQLKQMVVGLFALLMGGGALLGAAQGLVHGAVFCLLCRRNSPEVAFSRAPGLYLVSLAMLLALGALCLLAAWVCWRELMGEDGGRNQGSPPARPGSPHKATPPSPHSLPVRPTPATRRRPPPTARPPAATTGFFLHLVGATLYLGAAFFGVLAAGYAHSSADLSFAALLLPLTAFGLAFLGSVVLMNSPRPLVAWFARAVVALVVVAGLLLKLKDGLRP